MYDARQIANWFIDQAQRDQRSLTIMQLLKLVYIAHGWYLEMTNFPLIRNRIEAWKYGPVIPDVYNTFRRSDTTAVVSKAKNFDDVRDDYAESVLKQIYNLYGPKSAIELSNLTHESGGPWDLATKRSGYFAPIDNETILSHYRQKRQLATQ